MATATISAELHAVLKDIRVHEAGISKAGDRLEKLVQSLEGPKPQEAKPSLKRADGRLTDIGIAAVNAAFDAGATVTEVAKQFDIHVSASSNRRKIWLAGKSGAASA
jgi:hypothetical protein